MDSLTQMALGAGVAGAVAGRRHGGPAFAWGAIVGTLPDLDSLIPMSGPVAAFTYHRGYSHALPVHVLVAPALAWGINRLHAGTRADWYRWTLAVALVLITHALLDAMTIYGTQLGLPFTDYPVGLGSVFIIDPLYTLALLIGVGGALLRRRRWHRARHWNALGLLVSTAYLGWCVVAQQAVETRAAAAIDAQGLPVKRMLATPSPFNSILWRIVAVGETAYWEGFYTIGSGRPITLHRYSNRRWLLHGIEDVWAVRRLQYFTKGFYTVNLEGERAVIADLRMGQTPFWAFAFSVARVTSPAHPIVPARRYDYGRPPLAEALSALLACARGRPVELFRC